MRSPDLQADGELRAASTTLPGRFDVDDAAGVRAPVPGDRRGALRPGLARLDGVIPPAGRAQPAPGPVPGGWLDTPGPGGADGGAVGPAGGGKRAGGFAEGRGVDGGVVGTLGVGFDGSVAAGPGANARRGPAFDTPVAPGGYVWWYLDALSDDGEHGITVIAFIGSVFSPYYAWARRHTVHGAADPLNHCAPNVALYRRGSGGGANGGGRTGTSGHGATRWAMSERGRTQVQRDTLHLKIGPSALHWQGDTLTINIDEVAVPWPARIRGMLRLHAAQRFDQALVLAAQGEHRWFPIAPSARVEVDLAASALRWSGPGYFDSNCGDAPLERAFTRWDWSRAHLSGGRSVVLYDVERIGAPPLSVGLRFDATGAVQAIEPPPEAALPDTRWGVKRGTRSEAAARGSIATASASADPRGAPARVLQTLTDAPFYARSLLRSRWLGEPVTAIRESLSLTRFDSRWVQAMLPFRMPRVGR